MKINWNKWNRSVHFWGSLIIAIPVLFVIGSGLLLQVKKQVPWVQPKTMRGEGKIPTLSFDQILELAKTVPEAKIKGWGNVDRMDVRPGKGVIKLKAENSWEIQIDAQNGNVLQVNYRRSDLIESIHDGSFFHKHAKLWLFLPSGVIILILWMTGIYLLIKMFPARIRKIKRKTKQGLFPSSPPEQKLENGIYPKNLPSTICYSKEP